MFFTCLRKEKDVGVGHRPEGIKNKLRDSCKLSIAGSYNSRCGKTNTSNTDLLRQKDRKGGVIKHLQTPLGTVIQIRVQSPVSVSSKKACQHSVHILA